MTRIVYIVTGVLGALVAGRQLDGYDVLGGMYSWPRDGAR